MLLEEEDADQELCLGGTRLGDDHHNLHSVHHHPHQTLLPVQFTALLCLPPDVWLILAWILCWAGKEEDWTKVVDRLTIFYVVE